MNRSGFGAAIGAAVGTIGARAAGRITRAILTRLDADGKELFLTIDDGPSAGAVPIAEYLQARGVSATWFLVGERAEENPETVTRIVASDHAVGNHSYRHLDAWRSRRLTVEADLDAGLAALERLIDGPCVWTRPPYGRFTMRTLQWCAERGQQMVLWDVLASDFAPSAMPEEVASQVKASVRPGSIVAMHDRGGPEQFDTFKRTVETLINEGWEFRRLPATA